MIEPDFNLYTRVRTYPLGIKYKDATGQMHQYIRWGSGGHRKESWILIAIYYIWFRIIRAII